MLMTGDMIRMLLSEKDRIKNAVSSTNATVKTMFKVGQITSSLQASVSSSKQ